MWGPTIRYLLRQRQTTRGRLHPTLEKGPLGLLSQTLKQYGCTWADLERLPFQSRPSGRGTGDAGFRSWKLVTKGWIEEAVAKWAVRVGASLGEHMARSHFPEDEQQGRRMIAEGLPKFLRLCGDMGRAGLRMLAGKLGSTVNPNEKCALCGAPEGANTQHLLQCKALPPDLLRKRARAAAQRGVIRRDALLAQRDDPGTPDEPRRKRGNSAPSTPADPRPKQGGHKGKRCQAPQTGPRKKPKIQLDAWDW